MKLKHALLSLLMVFALTIGINSYADDQPTSADTPVEHVEVMAATIASAASGVDATDDSTISDPVPITQDDVAKTYKKWFADPGVFLLLVVLLTGLFFGKLPITGQVKQLLSWGLGIVLGIVGGLLGWGMFAGMDVLHSAILGLISAGFSNVLYNTGAFDSVLGIKK